MALMMCAWAYLPSHVIPWLGCPGWSSIADSNIQTQREGGCIDLNMHPTQFTWGLWRYGQAIRSHEISKSNNPVNCADRSNKQILIEKCRITIFIFSGLMVKVGTISEENAEKWGIFSTKIGSSPLPTGRSSSYTNTELSHSSGNLTK